MKRYESLTIEFNPHLLNSPVWGDIINQFNHEKSETICPQTKVVTIWFENYDGTVVLLPNVVIISGLNLWHDDGSQEVLVTEKNFHTFIFPQLKNLYKTRTGKYDTVQ